MAEEVNINNSAKKLTNSLISLFSNNQASQANDIVIGTVTNKDDKGNVYVSFEGGAEQVEAIKCGDFEEGDRVICTTNRYGNTIAIASTEEKAYAIQGTATLSLKVLEVGYNINCIYNILSPIPNGNLGFQWYRSGEAISGATKSTYTITVSDLNNYLYCRIYDKSGLYRGFVTSDDTDEIRKMQIFGSAYLSDDTPSPKQQIECLLQDTPATLKPSYQWYRENEIIEGATSATYQVNVLDDSYILKCVVRDRSGIFSGELVAYATSPVDYPELTGTVTIDNLYPYYTDASTTSDENSINTYLNVVLSDFPSDAAPRVLWFSAGFLLYASDNRPYTELEEIQLLWRENNTPISCRVYDNNENYKGYITSGSTKNVGVIYCNTPTWKAPGDYFNIGDNITLNINNIENSTIEELQIDTYIKYYNEEEYENQKYLYKLYRHDTISTANGEITKKVVDGKDYLDAALTFPLEAYGEITQEDLTGAQLQAVVYTARESGFWYNLPIVSPFEEIEIENGGALSDESGIIWLEEPPIITGTITFDKKYPYIGSILVATAKFSKQPQTNLRWNINLYDADSGELTASDKAYQKTNTLTINIDDPKYHNQRIEIAIDDVVNHNYDVNIKSAKTTVIYQLNDLFTYEQTNDTIQYKVIEAETRQCEVSAENRTNAIITQTLSDTLNYAGLPYRYDVPFTTVKIGDNAFKYSLAKNIVFSDIGLPSGQGVKNIKSVGNNAYENATNLLSPFIATHIITYGDEVFKNTTSFTDINLKNFIPEMTTKGMFQKSGLTTTGLNDNTTTKTINNYSYADCENLSATHFEDSQIENILENAFSGCENLAYVEFPITLKKLQENSFGNCTHLATIVFQKDARPIQIESKSTSGPFSNSENIKNIVFREYCKSNDDLLLSSSQKQNIKRYQTILWYDETTGKVSSKATVLEGTDLTAQFDEWDVYDGKTPTGSNNYEYKLMANGDFAETLTDYTYSNSHFEIAEDFDYKITPDKIEFNIEDLG